MSAVYTRQKTKHAGSFASDISAFSLAGLTTPLGIVQNVNAQFSQQVARIYDVSNGGLSSGGGGGDVPVFYVGGRTQGQATIGRVLGPQSGALCDFYEKLGNVCSPQDLTFTFAGGCDGDIGTEISTGSGASGFNKVSYSLQACVMINMGVQVGATDMIVNESVTLMFANMECSADGGGGGGGAAAGGSSTPATPAGTLST